MYSAINCCGCSLLCFCLLLIFNGVLCHEEEEEVSLENTKTRDEFIRCINESSDDKVALEQCVATEKRFQRIETVKEHILQSLQISNPNYKPTQEELDKAKYLYRREKRTDPNLRMQHIVSGATIGTRFILGRSANFTQVDGEKNFQRTLFTVNPAYTVVNATLWFFVRRPTEASQGDNQIFADVHLYKFINEQDINDDPIDYRKFPVEYNGSWVSFNLTGLVTEWRENLTNYGLYIRAQYFDGEDLVCRENDLHHLCLGNGNDPEKRVVLEIRLPDQPAITNSSPLMPKVRSFDCENARPDQKNKCCRQNLFIDFRDHDIDWGWIIAPQRVNIHMCTGECSLHSKLNRYTFTKVIQEIAASTTTDLGVCCAPHNVAGMTVLYFDEQKTFKKGFVPNLVVESCSCA